MIKRKIANKKYEVIKLFDIIYPDEIMSIN